eukprot:sb/3478425/
MSYSCRSSPNITIVYISDGWVDFERQKTQNTQKANLYYLQQTCPILILSTLTLIFSSDRPPHTVVEKDKIFLFPTQPRSSLYLIRNQSYVRNSLAHANPFT